MYRAFMIKHFDASGDWVREYAPIGRRLLSHASREVCGPLEAFLGEGGSIDGQAVQDDWFPQVHADVFLSHSHIDEDLALAIAGWAHSIFGLSVFVDSAIWGNATRLLRMIDNRYCRRPSTNVFDYQRRNCSTSHVHLMLATSLGLMIDKTECAWVLETVNSVTTRGAIGSTDSPWLYSELATLHHIRRRTLDAHRSGKTKLSKIMQEVAADPLKVIYGVPLGSLTALSVDQLNQWEEEYQRRLPHSHALDALYQLVPEVTVRGQE